MTGLQVVRSEDLGGKASSGDDPGLLESVGRTIYGAVCLDMVWLYQFTHS